MNLHRITGLVMAALVIGCNQKHSSADVSRGQKALVEALESWKANKPVETLKSLPDPVEYTDELRTTHKLIDYTVGKADPTDPEVIRYRVALKLQDRKGKLEERDVVFMVAMKSPIVIARDPYE